MGKKKGANIIGSEGGGGSRGAVSFLSLSLSLFANLSF
jgi:hypothetical protein